MNAKRIMNFLILRPAITTRNLTSLALVGLFFLIYLASGGTISTLPNVSTGEGFGSINTYEDSSPLLLGDVEKKNPTTIERVGTSVESAGDSARKRLLEKLQDEKSSSYSNNRQIRSDSDTASSENYKQESNDFADIEARLNKY